MVNETNERKTSQELAKEIREEEQNFKLFNDLIKGQKKIMDSKINDLEGTKHKFVIEAGEFIEKRHMVESEKICGLLKKSYKKYINQATIYFAVKDEHKDHWLEERIKGHKGSNQYIKYGKENNKPTTGYTKLEMDYIRAHENESKRNKLISELINSLSNLSIQEQGHILGHTPKGLNWRKALTDQCYEYMLTLTKQMITSDIQSTMFDLRTLRHLIDTFMHMLDDENEVRKSKRHLEIE